MDGWSKKKTKKTKSKRQKTTETTGGSSSSRETIDGPTLDGRSVLLSDEGPAQKNKKKREKLLPLPVGILYIRVCTTSRV
jgi:hypothetical protein